MKEDSYVEFKELSRMDGSLPRSTAKEICAFANTDGGDIYFGINDDGIPVGVSDTDDVMKRLSNLINDEILPSLFSESKIEVVEMEGKDIVKLSVSSGREKPYYLKRYGLTPNGTYIRVGSTCHNLSESGIREMIAYSGGLSWESQRCLYQNLTFNAFREAFIERGKEFNEWTLKNFGLVGSDGLYNNCAWIVSDQCDRSMQIKVYADRELYECSRVQEYTGSVIAQVKKALEYLHLINWESFEYDGDKSSKVHEYPPEALREALLNSVIHRDYSIKANNIIMKSPEKIRFISCGPLCRDLSIEDIMKGATEARNPILARIFKALDLIEGYGFGVLKIISSCKANGSLAEFSTTDARFYLDITPRNSDKSEADKEDDYRQGSVFMYSKSPEYSTEEKKPTEDDAVMELLKNRKDITRKDVENMLSVGQTKAFTILKGLQKKGLITQEKKGRSSLWHLA